MRLHWWQRTKSLSLAAPGKSCGQDPILTSLLKDCIDELLPLITRIINCSFQTEVVYCSLKTAQIHCKNIGVKVTPRVLWEVYTPHTLQHQCFCSVHPILTKANALSNLPFLARIPEHILSIQQHASLDEHELHSELQSTFHGDRAFCVQTVIITTTRKPFLYLWICQLRSTP